MNTKSIYQYDNIIMFVEVPRAPAIVYPLIKKKRNNQKTNNKNGSSKRK